jgi:SAM-dependent methyltransferase
VLGIGAASLSLAQATPREQVKAALDIGTGCGVQSLHLAAHSASVTATDISARALQLAATTAALSGQDWTLRRGSLLAPVEGQRFDQVVANPPFVVSPGLGAATGGYDYRDSGLAGDEVCARLVREVPSVLGPGGTASILANWVITADQTWDERVGGWLSGTGCDAWVWQREVAEPGEYVALWLRDAGEQPGTQRWAERYRRWLDWFRAERVLAVGMGLVTLWRTDSSDPVVVCEDVPQPMDQPVGRQLPGWIARQRWLRDHDDTSLLGARFRCAAGVVRDRADLRGPDGWRTERTTLRQSFGLRWELEADDLVAGLVGGSAGVLPLGTQLDLLAAALGAATAEVTAGAVPVVRDLVARGFLEPLA